NLSSVSGKSDSIIVATIHMAIFIQNINHLHNVVERIKQIKYI
ncbi:hypothetical protein, partial [Bacillus altitudinis]